MKLNQVPLIVTFLRFNNVGAERSAPALNLGNHAFLLGSRRFTLRSDLILRPKLRFPVFYMVGIVGCIGSMSREATVRSTAMTVSHVGGGASSLAFIFVTDAENTVTVA